MVSFLAVDPIKDRKGGFTPRFHLRVTAGRVFIFEAPSSEEAVAWMTALQRAIRRGETKTLEDHFTRTRDIRRGIIDAKQD